MTRKDRHDLLLYLAKHGKSPPGYELVDGLADLKAAYPPRPVTREAVDAFARAYADLEEATWREFYRAHGMLPLVAFADCQRCGAPAHPVRGYCGRFCEEASAYDAEHRTFGDSLVCHRPGFYPRVHTD